MGFGYVRKTAEMEILNLLEHYKPYGFPCHGASEGLGSEFQLQMPTERTHRNFLSVVTLDKP